MTQIIDKPPIFERIFDGHSSFKSKGEMNFIVELALKSQN